MKRMLSNRVTSEGKPSEITHESKIDYRKDNNMNTDTRVENYREFFTKNYLMGPNSLRLLDEMLRKFPLKEGGRVMDLGCGMGITSLFLAKEARVNVFATDLWISATQNAENFRKWGIDEQIIPIFVVSQVR